MDPVSIPWSTRAVIYSKTLSTLSPVLAEVSKYSKPCFTASFYASSAVTSLLRKKYLKIAYLSSRSVLLPTTNNSILSHAYPWISVCHLIMFKKDALLVTSKTINPPMDLISNDIADTLCNMTLWSSETILNQPRYKEMMNTVSQIWSLIYLSLTCRLREPNSTPIVASCSERNLESVNCSRRQLFPTSRLICIVLLVSPTMMNLKR